MLEKSLAGLDAYLSAKAPKNGRLYDGEPAQRTFRASDRDWRAAAAGSRVLTITR